MDKKKLFKILLGVIIIVLFFSILIMILLLSSGYKYAKFSPDMNYFNNFLEKKYQDRDDLKEESKSGLSKFISNIQKKKNILENFKPKDEYIVIDSYYNRLYLRKDDKNLLDATCSAGSGAILVDTPNVRKWIFDTPVGEFQVLNKVKNPVWKKPDWAFVEEGKPIPKDPAERFEYGMLGEYALYFSTEGYLIHGTIYESFLGRNITHGCIRLGREDLDFLFKNTKIGTKVYVY